MNPDPHRLLDEVLEETAPADFRSAVLKQTLRHVRRRRVARRTQRGLVAFALLVGLPLVIWRTVVVPLNHNAVGPARMAKVSTQPPATIMLIESKAGAVSIVTSSVGSVVIIETAAAKDSFKEISDEELLALVAGRPAVLVKHSPQQAELLFVNAEDQNGFRVQ